MSDLTPAAKLRVALELFDLGVDLMRQNLRRRHPGESEAQIDRRLGAWLHERPGAVDGDAVGRRRPDPGSGGRVWPMPCGASSSR